MGNREPAIPPVSGCAMLNLTVRVRRLPRIQIYGKSSSTINPRRRILAIRRLLPNSPGADLRRAIAWMLSTEKHIVIP